jgi:L-alanine-DL-glutamate epimerase-like enolase superfamily enzyme
MWTGWGEASPYQTIQGETQATQLITGQLIAKSLIGKNSADLDGCLDHLDSVIAFNRCIKSAFEMALQDIHAKIREMPLYKILGGHSKVLKTDMTVGIGSPESMVESAVNFARQGFTEIKIKLGKDPRQDITRVSQIRKALGPDIKLRIDANQGWNPEEAVHVLREIHPYSIDHCEQPVSARNNQAMKKVNDLSPIPIMADESLFDSNDAQSLIALQACSQFNIKLGKSGGIREALKILNLAESYKLACQVGCFSESRLGITALAHLAVSSGQVVYYDMDSPLMLSEDPVLGGAVYKQVNEIHVNESPGLGLEIDPRFLKNLDKIEIS